MKNTPSNAYETPQAALLFIPDISGFTRFISETEISHSQHIIEELLEVILDANDIGLEVSEIEGDAVLFYRFGKAPAADEILALVQKMFVHFHTHLKKYHSHRVCQCGACKTAHQLTLKFVAHYGEITMNKVKQYRKLFGKEVIVVHRLLKNDIEHHEYVLLTNDLVKAAAFRPETDTATWAPLQQSIQQYDSGTVQFSYLPLAPLMDQIPELKPEDYSLTGVKQQVLETEAIVEAPLEMVFNIVSDLPWRNKWVPGVLPQGTDINSKLSQVGQTHRCLANGPVNVAHDFETGEDVITFTETDQKKNYSVVYTFKRLDKKRTHLHAVTFMRANKFKIFLFRLFLKKKLGKIYEQAWLNLNNYCKGLLTSEVEHPYKIVLENKSVPV